MGGSGEAAGDEVSELVFGTDAYVGVGGDVGEEVGDRDLRRHVETFEQKKAWRGGGQLVLTTTNTLPSKWM